MKLFIWEDPCTTEHGFSVAVAVAETVDQAKLVAMHGLQYRFGAFEQGFVPPELGDPDRIIECPCAEWYEWDEKGGGNPEFFYVPEP